MPDQTNTPDEPIVVEIDIAAPPERVFEALTDPGQLSTWWGDEPFASPRRSGVRREPEVIESDSPRVLVWSWGDVEEGRDNTVVRWELTPTDAGTHVRIIQAWMLATPVLAGVSLWQVRLLLLAAFVETLQPRPTSCV